MDDSRKKLLELKKITKVFPGVKALDEVDFDLYPGEIHSLCGENGAGKSTLIKIMTGAHERTGGEYLVDGAGVCFKSTQEAIKAGVSCVYQELSIAPQLDIAQNLYIGNLPVKGKLIDYATLYRNSRNILEELGMGKISPKTLCGQLSVGQQQMIEIGRALTRNARVIIMDEPTSSLSKSEIDVLFAIILKLKAKGISIVYISHKLDEVMYLSDRITVIRDGQNITTTDKADTNKEKLIADMIGRPLENLYNKTPAAIGKPVLEVRSLTRSGVFNDISFSLRAGEIVGFFGLVGAGRSEIMRAIFGADKYNSGEVILEGKKLRPYSPSQAIRSGIGFCTEDRKKEGLMLRLSILLNMTLVKLSSFAKMGFVRKAMQEKAAEAYVGNMSIKTPSIDQLAGNLSGGNQQKVVLAKWLLIEPKVLIIDEPTRGIDVGSKAEIYGLLSELAQQGVAIIVVSSEIEEIMGICDRVITVCEGTLTAEFPVSNLDRQKVLAAAIGQCDP